MPETREITVFKFEELSERAQDKARQWYAEHGMCYEWWDGDYEDAKDQGKERGFDIDDIRFSGFWSQGDGASWTGHIIVRDFLNWLLAQPENSPQYRRMEGARHRYTVLQEIIEADCGSDMPELFERVCEVIRSGYHYVHSNTMQIAEPNCDGLYDIMETMQEDEIIPAGVLKGASIRDLAKGIDADVLFNELHEIMVAEAKNYADEIYEQLEQTYDDLNSDDSITEACEANDWRFDEYGRFI